ncbi:MAG: FtsB family cell division protein [Alphaproteobacteria bacterium]
MSFVDKIRERARPVSIRVLAVGLIVYFGYHIVEGDRGLIAWLRLEDKLAVAETRLAGLHMQRQHLEQRISLIRDRHIDEDLLDEQVRRMLNLIRANEIVIYDRGAGK